MTPSLGLVILRAEVDLLFSCPCFRRHSFRPPTHPKPLSTPNPHPNHRNPNKANHFPALQKVPIHPTQPRTIKAEQKETQKYLYLTPKVQT
jgi:hypothetical protein